MSQRWLDFLHKFGGSPRSTGAEAALESSFAAAGRYERYDVLFHIYGPVAESPWVPYHCPTLFACIERQKIRPREIELAPAYFRPRPEGAFAWLGPDTSLIVDLPGAATIKMAAILMKYGAQPICTFDHWDTTWVPATSRGRSRKSAVIQSTEMINTMFTLAPEVHESRQKLTTDSPPAWICDSRRLAPGVRPSPGTFDNRYYIDDSILAGIPTLKKAGIRRVVYFSMNIADEVQPDLIPHFIEADKEGLVLERLALLDESTWMKPVEMKVPFKRNLPIHGFRRSDMGGFGQMVPVPSEGSYSSGGGGG